MTRGAGTRAPEPSSCGPFEPALATSDGRRADAVALVRRGGPDGSDAGAVVWMRRFDVPAEARRFHRWMLGKAGRWAIWGRMAPILGPEFLGGQIGSEHDADRQTRREKLEWARTQRRWERTIRCRQFDDGRWPAIGMFQGNADKPFFRMRFDERWERERVWDFVSQRTELYHGWKALFQEQDAATLERTILDDMLRTEREVKKAGLGAGGRRPLRFWRGGDK